MCTRRLRLMAPFAVLFVVPILFIAVACDDEDSGGETLEVSSPEATTASSPESTPTGMPSARPASTSSATSTPPPVRTNTVEYSGYQIVDDFEYVEPVDFPENLLMVIETGCSRCDGPTEALYRVWRNSGGTHVDRLVDASISGAENAYITSFALQPDLSDMVITVCTDCGDGNPLVESPVKVYRSLDGGITWREIDSANPGAPVFARSITRDGIVLADANGALHFWRGDVIQPPAGAHGLLQDSNHTGELLWLAANGSAAIDAYGTSVVQVEPGSLISAMAVDGSESEQPVVGWAISYVSGPFEGWAVTQAGPDGRQIGFRSEGYVEPVTLLPDGRVVGVMPAYNELGSNYVGFIDARKGWLTPIQDVLLEPPFGDGLEPNSRNVLQAALVGPFLRVSAGTSCLPIRVSTDQQSREITCAADGTLLYDLRNTTTVGGQQWSKVRLLDGREGYAVISFLASD